MLRNYADAHRCSNFELGLLVGSGVFVCLFACLFFLFLRAGEAKHRGIIGRGQGLRLRKPYTASRLGIPTIKWKCIPCLPRNQEWSPASKAGTPSFSILDIHLPMADWGERGGLYAKANWKSTPLRLLPSQLLLIAPSHPCLSQKVFKRNARVPSAFKENCLIQYGHRKSSWTCLKKIAVTEKSLHYHFFSPHVCAHVYRWLFSGEILY